MGKGSPRFAVKKPYNHYEYLNNKLLFMNGCNSLQSGNYTNLITH